MVANKAFREVRDAADSYNRKAKSYIFNIRFEEKWSVISYRFESWLRVKKRGIDGFAADRAEFLLYFKYNSKSSVTNEYTEIAA